MSARFPLGVVVATPGALDLLARWDLDDLLRRHQRGDWGELDGHDRRANERALRDGARLLSSYPLGDGKVWIITEADRSSTCVLLPEDY